MKAAETEIQKTGRLKEKRLKKSIAGLIYYLLTIIYDKKYISAICNTLII